MAIPAESTPFTTDIADDFSEREDIHRDAEYISSVSEGHPNIPDLSADLLSSRLSIEQVAAELVETSQVLRAYQESYKTLWNSCNEMKKSFEEREDSDQRHIRRLQARITKERSKSAADVQLSELNSLRDTNIALNSMISELHRALQTETALRHTYAAKVLHKTGFLGFVRPMPAPPLTPTHSFVHQTVTLQPFGAKDSVTSVPRKYDNFSYVFTPHDSNAAVWEQCMAFVDAVFYSYDQTSPSPLIVLACGRSGTGKTYLMVENQGVIEGETVPDDASLVTRICHSIFSHAQRLKVLGTSLSVTLSCKEVAFGALDGVNVLLEETELVSLPVALMFVRDTHHQRKTADTSDRRGGGNARSSRSHLVMTFTITLTPCSMACATPSAATDTPASDSASSTTTSITLVDLAGNESAPLGTRNDATFRESTEINYSLSTLQAALQQLAHNRPHTHLRPNNANRPKPTDRLLALLDPALRHPNPHVLLIATVFAATHIDDEPTWYANKHTLDFLCRLLGVTTPARPRIGLGRAVARGDEDEAGAIEARARAAAASPLRARSVTPLPSRSPTPDVGRTRGRGKSRGGDRDRAQSSTRKPFGGTTPLTTPTPTRTRRAQDTETRASPVAGPERPSRAELLHLGVVEGK